MFTVLFLVSSLLKLYEFVNSGNSSNVTSGMNKEVIFTHIILFCIHRYMVSILKNAFPLYSGFYLCDIIVTSGIRHSVYLAV